MGNGRTIHYFNDFPVFFFQVLPPFFAGLGAIIVELRQVQTLGLEASSALLPVTEKEHGCHD